MTHPIALEYQVKERQEELRALAESAHAARAARSAHRRGDVGSWRRLLGRVLVTLGVSVGLPRQRRGPAVRDAVALLETGCPTEPAAAAA